MLMKFVFKDTRTSGSRANPMRQTESSSELLDVVSLANETRERPDPFFVMTFDSLTKKKGHYSAFTVTGK